MNMFRRTCNMQLISLFYRLADRILRSTLLRLDCTFLWSLGMLSVRFCWVRYVCRLFGYMIRRCYQGTICGWLTRGCCSRSWCRFLGFWSLHGCREPYSGTAQIRDLSGGFVLPGSCFPFLCLGGCCFGFLLVPWFLFFYCAASAIYLTGYRTLEPAAPLRAAIITLMISTANLAQFIFSFAIAV